MIDRNACDSVAPLVERVEVRALECGLARRARVRPLGAADEPDHRAVAGRHAKIGRQRRVLKRAVWLLIVGAESLRADRVLKPAGCARRVRAGAQGSEGASLDAGGSLRPHSLAVRTLRDHLDDAGHGVRAEQRRVRAAHDLQALEILCGQIAEIEGAARLVQRDPVEQDLVVAALAAADEQRREGAGASAADDGRPRHVAQQIGDERRLPDLQILGGERGDAGAGLIGGCLGARRTDDDRFLDRRNRQHDAERCLAARHARRLESGERDLEPAACRGGAQAEPAAFVGKGGRSARCLLLDTHEGARQRLTGLVDNGAGQFALASVGEARCRECRNRNHENKRNTECGPAGPPKAGYTHQVPPGVSRAEERTPSGPGFLTRGIAPLRTPSQAEAQ